MVHWTMKIPIALTIAGSDSGGGAGIQADLKAMSALGVYGASVITAVTAQNTVAVSAVHEMPPDIVAAQISTVLSDIEIDAIKLGMLFSPAIIAAVADELAQFSGPVVIDPVMVSKSGDALLQDAAIDALISQLLPHACLLTPNLPEAARLLNRTEAKSPREMIAQGRQLLSMGPQAVLIKGGHATGNKCTDVLVQADGAVDTFEAPRIVTRNTHGTGCTFSAAITAHLAKGQGLANAVELAHTYLHAAIVGADRLSVGRGHGPVHHFHGYWT
jgi:hydroxymethylpyrimidine/phosphomethylpyrimidine kinase